MAVDRLKRRRPRARSGQEVGCRLGQPQRRMGQCLRDVLIGFRGAFPPAGDIQQVCRVHHPEQAKLPLSLQVPVLVQRQIRILVTAEGHPGMHQGQQELADIIVPNPVEMPQGVAEPLLLCRLHGQHQTGHRRALGQRHGAFGDGRRPLDPAGQHMGAPEPGSRRRGDRAPPASPSQNRPMRGPNPFGGTHAAPKDRRPMRSGLAAAAQQWTVRRPMPEKRTTERAATPEPATPPGPRRRPRPRASPGAYMLG